MKTKLRKIDIANVTKIKARTILDWTQRGYLIPDKKIIGQGKTSHYSPANAVQAKVLSILSDAGISIKKNNPLLAPVNIDLFDPFKSIDKSILKINKNIKGTDIKIEINIKKIKTDIGTSLKKLIKKI